MGVSVDQENRLKNDEKGKPVKQESPVKINEETIKVKISEKNVEKQIVEMNKMYVEEKKKVKTLDAHYKDEKALEEEIEILKNHKDEDQKLITSLENKVSQLQILNTEMNIILEKERAKIKANEEKYKSQQSKLNECNAENKAILNTNDVLNKKIVDLNKQILILNKEKSEMEKVQFLAAKKIETYKKEKESFEHQIEELQAEKKEVDETLVKTNKKFKRQTKKLQDSNNEKDILRRENENFNEQIKNLKSDLNTLTVENKQIKRDYNKRMDELNKLKKESKEVGCFEAMCFCIKFCQ